MLLNVIYLIARQVKKEPDLFFWKKNTNKRFTGNNGVNNSMSANKQQLNNIHFCKNTFFFHIHPEYFPLLHHLYSDQTGKPYLTSPCL